MSIQELEAEAMRLSEKERAGLASRLLASLSPVLSDDDEGLAEALRRDKEMDNDPAASMTMEEFKSSLGR